MIYCVVGESGSGKTEFIRLLRKIRRIPSFKIGRLLEIILNKKGQDLHRYMEEQRDLKGKHVAIEIIMPFLRKAYYKYGGFILEGLTNKEELNFLQVNFHENPRLIFITANEETRIRRRYLKENITIAEAKEKIKRRDINRKDFGMNDLKEIADIIIENNYSNMIGFYRHINSILKRKNYIKRRS